MPEFTNFTPEVSRSDSKDPVQRFLEDTDHLVDMLHRAQQYIAAHPGMCQEVGSAVATDLRKVAGLSPKSLTVDANSGTYDTERPLQQLVPRLVCLDAQGETIGRVLSLDLATGYGEQAVRHNGETVVRDGKTVTEPVQVDSIAVKLQPPLKPR